MSAHCEMEASPPLPGVMRTVKDPIHDLSMSICPLIDIVHSLTTFSTRFCCSNVYTADLGDH